MATTINHRMQKIENKRNDRVFSFDSGRVVDFFVVGMPRSGTTSLFHYLREHPDVSLAKKDNHFFAVDGHFGYYKPPAIKDYEATLLSQKGHVWGDVSVSYLLTNSAVEAIHAHNSNAKIIILLRNPIETMYSLYMHQKRANREPDKTFLEAYQSGKERQIFLRTNNKPWNLHIDIAEYSLYHDIISNLPFRINRFLELFGENQVFIINYNDYQTNTKSTFSKIESFLGLKHVDIQFRIHNAHREKRRYAHMFKPILIQVAKCEKLLREQVVFSEKTGVRLAALLKKARLWISEKEVKRETLDTGTEEFLKNDLKEAIMELEKYAGKLT